MHWPHLRSPSSPRAAASVKRPCAALTSSVKVFTRLRESVVVACAGIVANVEMKTGRGKLHMVRNGSWPANVDDMNEITSAAQKWNQVRRRRQFWTYFIEDSEFTNHKSLPLPSPNHDVQLLLTPHKLKPFRCLFFAASLLAVLD